MMGMMRQHPASAGALVLALVMAANSAGAQQAVTPVPPATPLAVPPPSAGAPVNKLPPTVAGIIDYHRIMRDSKAARTIRQQVDARQKIYQAEIAKEEKKLVDTDKELTRQRAVLSADAFQQKRQDFDKKVAEVQRLVQERRRQLDQVSAAALNEVRKGIIEIVAGMARARGFNLVVPSSGVLVFSPEIDMTDDVVAELDRRLPSVKVPEKVAQQQ